MSVTLGLQTDFIEKLSTNTLKSSFKQEGQVCEDNNTILIHNTHLFIYEFKCIFQLLSMSMFYIFFSVRMVQYLC